MADDTPFTLSPNPTTLYLTPIIRSALIKSRIAIDKRQGLSCILGDNGLGKSTVLRFLYAEYGARERHQVTLIPTPDFNNSEFAMIKSICQDFNLPAKRSLVAQREEMQRFLVEQAQVGMNVVIFIDEAQLLNNKMLETVRAMLNWETHQSKLVQIVLAGQLELRDRLLSAANKAIKSRIFASSLLAALTPDEMAAMIDNRCRFAEIPNPFPPPTLERLYELTAGIPRDTLKLCTLAYEMMQMGREREVSVDLLESACAEDALRAQPA
jgi:general secretion pathway protein A